MLPETGSRKSSLKLQSVTSSSDNLISHTVLNTGILNLVKNSLIIEYEIERGLRSL